MYNETPSIPIPPDSSHEDSTSSKTEDLPEITYIPQPLKLSDSVKNNLSTHVIPLSANKNNIVSYENKDSIERCIDENSQNSNQKLEKIVSENDISKSSWSNIKWQTYQNNIVAYKSVPDNLLAYVVANRGRHNIKIMKAEDSECKLLIKGFQKDIIELKWNNLILNPLKQQEQLNILSALDVTGCLYVYEIILEEKQNGERDPGGPASSALKMRELAIFNAGVPANANSFDQSQKMDTKIKVYDEDHSFILFTIKNIIHLIDLNEYYTHIKNVSNNFMDSNDDSRENHTASFTFQLMDQGDQKDSDDDDDDDEEENDPNSDDDEPNINDNKRSMLCNGRWINDLEETLNEDIVTSHMLKGNIQKLYDACIAPTGEYLAVSDNLGRLTFWNVDEGTMAHVFKPYGDISDPEIINDLSSKNTGYISFFDGPDCLMWQYLITCNETQNELRLWNTSDWNCIHALKFCDFHEQFTSIHHLKFSYLEKLSCLFILDTSQPRAFLLKTSNNFPPEDLENMNIDPTTDMDNHFSFLFVINLPTIIKSISDISVEIKSSNRLIPSGKSTDDGEIGELFFYGLSERWLSSYKIDVSEVLNFENRLKSLETSRIFGEGADNFSQKMDNLKMNILNTDIMGHPTLETQISENRSNSGFVPIKEDISSALKIPRPSYELGDDDSSENSVEDEEEEEEEEQQQQNEQIVTENKTQQSDSAKISPENSICSKSDEDQEENDDILETKSTDTTDLINKNLDKEVEKANHNVSEQENNNNNHNRSDDHSESTGSPPPLVDSDRNINSDEEHEQEDQNTLDLIMPKNMSLSNKSRQNSAKNLENSQTQSQNIMSALGMVQPTIVPSITSPNTSTKNNTHNLSRPSEISEASPLSLKLDQILRRNPPNADKINLDTSSISEKESQEPTSQNLLNNQTSPPGQFTDPAIAQMNQRSTGNNSQPASEKNTSENRQVPSLFKQLTKNLLVQESPKADSPELRYYDPLASENDQENEGEKTHDNIVAPENDDQNEQDHDNLDEIDEKEQEYLRKWNEKISNQFAINDILKSIISSETEKLEEDQKKAKEEQEKIEANVIPADNMTELTDVTRDEILKADFDAEPAPQIIPEPIQSPPVQKQPQNNNNSKNHSPIKKDPNIVIFTGSSANPNNTLYNSFKILSQNYIFYNEGAKEPHPFKTQNMALNNDIKKQSYQPFLPNGSCCPEIVVLIVSDKELEFNVGDSWKLFSQVLNNLRESGVLRTIIATEDKSAFNHAVIRFCAKQAADHVKFGVEAGDVGEKVREIVHDVLRVFWGVCWNGQGLDC